MKTHPRLRFPRRACLGLLLATASLLSTGCGTDPAAPDAAPRPASRAPRTLSATGLFADASCSALAPGVRSFTPQYPLWSDGAAKRRWILLPEGAAIDAGVAEAWDFPAGTRLWKEFRFEQRVETRYMERTPAGTWTYATYLWSEGLADAVLAPESGVRGACETGRGTRHDVPSVPDCRACHDGNSSGVLGFSALQLSDQRDPLAPHAEPGSPADLRIEELLASGRLAGDADAIRAAAQPIDARSPRERAALGYLAANCGGCHNGSGPLASLGLELDVRRRAGRFLPALASAVGVPSRFQPAGAHGALRIAPGDPQSSVAVQRMASRFGPTQMPPLGTRVVDEEALALLREWIHLDLATPRGMDLESEFFPIDGLTP